MTAVGSDNGQTSTGAAELRQEIAHTRERLGETVEALAAKADVKARARESVETAKLRARESVHQAAVTATEVGRDFKADPMGQLRLAAVRVQRSVREQPTPWLVAAGMVALAVLLSARRRSR